MRVLVTGSEGFLASRLIRALRGDPRVTEIRAFDVALGHDLRDARAVADAVAGCARVYHLAFVTGASAARDWAGALETNVAGTANLLAACAREPEAPVFVFASAVAVYGPTPDGVVDDDTPATGTGPYASAKRALEILIGDAARAGRVDGRSIRLPTTMVRPARIEPTTAGFLSDLVVARANGRDFQAHLPFDTPVAVAGLRRTVRALRVAGDSDGAAFGPARVAGLPTIAASARAVMAACERVLGPRPGTVVERPDPRVQALIATWPRAVRSARASALGLDADETLDEIVRRYRDDPEGLQIP
jgi:nucleoside-diphosphate-sugar epimerase